METQLSFYATVEAGQLKSFNRKAFQLGLKEFEGKRVELVLKRAKKQRSLQANAYYHAVVIPCIRHGLKEVHGFLPSATEVHEFLKGKFNIKELVNLETGEYEKFPMSTTHLSTTEFGEYVDRCKAFALEFLNVSIPEPDKQTSITYA